MDIKQTVKDIRSILGDVYYPNDNRGAKTNELGLTKTQVINLAEEITNYIKEKHYE